MGIRGRKILSLLLVCTLLPGILSGCGKDQSKSEKEDLPVIKVGSDNYPPYNYLDEDGNPTGIDIELAKEAFSRMGYQTEFVYIDWDLKKDLVEAGDIDCIWGSFSMEGRLDDYKWAGSYMVSNQVVAVDEKSDIYSLADLEGKNVIVQSTTKPEGIFLDRTDSRIPEVGSLICVENRNLLFTFLAKGYADALAGHETFIRTYMKDEGVSYRILDETLMTVGLGVAFSKNDDRGICDKLDETLEEMRKDGTSEKIIGKYLEDPAKYLEVEQLAY